MFVVGTAMDTLKSIRCEEMVTELTKQVLSNADTVYLFVELERRDPHEILVVMNHYDEIVDRVLSQINPDESGYVFFASELEIDPINNCMVPKHRMATSEEIDGLIYRKVPLDKLPMLCMLDPIRRWHNFPRGSIVAIDRGVDNVYFRRVV